MVVSNFNLQAHNTFGINAIAKEFSRFSSIDELENLVHQKNNSPLLILGGGSNLLFTQNYEGLVLKNEILGKTVIKEDENHVWVQVGAGENWHDFVIYCIENNWGGIENLSLIPGNVGASPMQNIGAYGVEIKDVFESLEAFHLTSKEVHTFNNKACKFGYRESVFKRDLKGQYVICNVTYKLTKKDHKLSTSYGAIQEELKKMGIQEPTISAISQAVIAIRSSKLPNPAEIGNAGSFFKNPVVSSDIFENLQKNHPTIPHYKQADGTVKIPAGWLIEQAGWKGKVVGNTGVHKKQALVLVNYGNATGKEIFDLSETILQDVFSKFGVALEREVNIVEEN